MSEPMVTYFADEYTLKRLAEVEAENARLREKIEQLELLEARSAREADAERKRAEFWRGECAKRARFLDEVEGHLSGYGFDDELSNLMQMPEEPTKLEAERLTTEERQVIRRALHTDISSELVGMDEFKRICAVRAKSEAMGGSEG